MVPGIPQIGRVFLMIALGVLCFLVLLDVLGAFGALNFPTGRRLFSC
jgi:hypothetical protein